MPSDEGMSHLGAAQPRSASAARSEGTRWAVVAIAVLAGVVAAFHVGKAPPALPAIRGELGLGLVAAGWVVSIFAATGALLAAPGGMVADRLGHRPMLLGGLAVLALGGVGGAMAGSEWTLLASRFVEGLGLVGVVVAAPSLIVQATAPRHGRIAIAFWSSYMPAGIALVMLAAPAVLEPLGWRWLWLAAAAMALLCLAAARRVVVDLPHDRTPLDWAETAAAIARPGPWLLAVSFTVYAWQWASLMVWMPTFLVEQRGAGGFAAAALTALVVAVNVPGNLLGGWLLHREVPRWLLLAGGFAAMGLLAQGIFWEWLPDLVRYLLCAAFSFIAGVVPPALLAGVPAHSASPRQMGMVNGMVVQGSNGGHLVGPPLTAVVVTWSGAWAAAGWSMGGGALAGLALAVVLRAVERRMTG